MVIYYNTMSKSRVIAEIMKLEEMLDIIPLSRWTEKELIAMKDETLFRRLKILNEWKSTTID